MADGGVVRFPKQSPSHLLCKCQPPLHKGTYWRFGIAQTLPPRVKPRGVFLVFFIHLQYTDRKGGEDMPTKPMTVAGLAEYLRQCRAMIPQDAVFVCGHDAPDTDAVVSSVAEAYRRHLTDDTPAVPIIPAESLPAEIAYLLGDTLAELLLCERAVEIAAPAARFILTDHHDVNNRRVIAIVDHHPPREGVDLSGIDADIRLVGAATTLVVERCLKDGLVPDAGMARLLLGAVLTDTEGLSPAKTRAEDRAVAEHLMALWGGDPAALFADLRGRLLAESDLSTLYHRDYRRFGNALGFAVIKVWDTTPIDEDALRALLAADREESGVAATLAKITRYGQDGLKDESYFISAPPALTQSIADTIRRAAGDAASVSAPDRIDLPQSATHLSRKRLTPILLSRV